MSHMVRSLDLPARAVSPRGLATLASASPNGLVEWIGHKAMALTVPSGTVLFSQNEPATGLILIEQGVVSLLRQEYTGTSVLVRMCGASSLLGLAAVMASVAHAQTAVTRSLSVVRIVRDKLDLEFLAREPSLAVEMLKWLALENVHHVVRCGELGALSAAERLARVLLRHVLSDAEPARVQVTSGELPLLAGADASHVSRLLRAFRRDRLIEMRRGRVVILDLSRLRVRAGLDHALANLPSQTCF